MSKKNFNGSIILLVATVVFQQFAFLYFHIYHPKQLAMPTISNPRSQSAASAIVLTGFIAGTLDITAACIQYYIRTGKGPANVLRYVASGMFGKKALTGGVPMAAWGLLFHYIIAFVFTLFFFWICPKINLQSKNKIITGLVYGAFVWAIMNLAIIRLSNIPPPPPFDISKAAIAMLILMFCIGLPISLLIGKYYTRKTNQ